MLLMFIVPRLLSNLANDWNFTLATLQANSVEAQRRKISKPATPATAHTAPEAPPATNSDHKQELEPIRKKAKHVGKMYCTSAILSNTVCPHLLRYLVRPSKEELQSNPKETFLLAKVLGKLPNNKVFFVVFIISVL